MVSVDKVRLKWIALCLDERAFNEIIEIGRFDDGELIDWKKILAILCTSLGTVIRKKLKQFTFSTYMFVNCCVHPFLRDDLHVKHEV